VERLWTRTICRRQMERLARLFVKQSDCDGTGKLPERYCTYLTSNGKKVEGRAYCTSCFVTWGDTSTVECESCMMLSTCEFCNGIVFHYKRYILVLVPYLTFVFCDHDFVGTVLPFFEGDGRTETGPSRGFLRLMALVCVGRPRLRTMTCSMMPLNESTATLASRL